MNPTLSYFLGLFCAFAALYGIALFYNRQLRLYPEEGLAYAILTTILAVFLFACLKNASIAVYLLCTLALAGYFLAFSGRIVTKKGLQSAPTSGKFLSIFTPGIQLYLILFILAAVFFCGTCYQNWDEFVQWGKAVRYMGATGALPVGSEYDGMEYMQSASTCFHYFVGYFTGFDEAASYVSNALLCLGCLPLSMVGQGERTHRRTFAFGVFMLLALYAVYELPFYNLYVDVPLALWTGSLILYGITSLHPGADIKRWVLAGLMFLCIGFMKPTAGILFAVFALLAILAMLPGSRSRTSVYSVEKLSAGKKVAIGIALAAAAASPFLMRRIWSGMVSSGGIYLNFSLLTERANRLRPLFYTLYRGAFADLASANGISFATCFIVSTALLLLGDTLFPRGLERTRWLRTCALYVIGFAAYFVITYGTYLLILPAADAENGTSLARYFSLYVMAGLIPICAPFFRQSGRLPGDSGPIRQLGGDIRYALNSGICLLLVTALALSVKSDILYSATSALRWDDPYYTMYMDTRSSAEEVIRVTKGEPVYYINQAYDSAAAAAEYCFSKQWDRGTGPYRFSEDTDIAVTGLTNAAIDTLPELLKTSGASYLYIDRTDIYFNEAFELLFLQPCPEDGDLYRIDTSGEQTELIWIENAKAFAKTPEETERMH